VAKRMQERKTTAMRGTIKNGEEIQLTMVSP
jgi:hypothetical protein